MMILDFMDTIDSWNDKIIDFLDKYSGNPIFWIILLIVLFAFGCFAVQYLNKK